MSLIRKKSVPSLACFLILVRGRGLEISSEGNSVSDESDIVRATVITMTKNEKKRHSICPWTLHIFRPVYLIHEIACGVLSSL